MLLVLVFLGLVPCEGYSQAPIDTVKSLTGIEITTSVDKGEAYVGDLIEYRLTIVYDSTFELVPPPLGANLGGFEVKDYQLDQISRLDDGRLSSLNTFVLSTFIIGDYVIPPVPVLFNLPDSSRHIILSESVPIKVKSMLEGASDTISIRPLKPQYEFEGDLIPTEVLQGGGLLSLIVLLLLLIHWLRKRKQRKKSYDLRPPWEKAFETLALLQQKSLLKDGEFKQFYVELSMIIRLYYYRVKYTDVKEMTTDEFQIFFESRIQADNIYDLTHCFFQRADLVKFAKNVPTVESAEADLKIIHGIVETIRLEIQRQHEQQASEPETRTSKYETPEVTR